MKPVIAGLIGALIAMLAWAALSFTISGSFGQSGGLGAASLEFPSPIAGVVGFVAGFYLQHRRRPA